MTPCEKLGYKVGDRFEVVGYDRHQFTVGETVTLSKDCGTDRPEFEGNYHTQYVFLKDVKKLPFTPKDPIEYLKTAYANGDIIYPETMLRECYGITKTERVVVEWSEVKREIKVGDKVRIVGWSIVGYEQPSRALGTIHVVTKVDNGDTEFPYSLGGIWFPASSVELV